MKVNDRQKNALETIANFIEWYASDETERDRLWAAACDYVEQDHVLAEESLA
jgi:hypothetical protein